MADIIFWAGFCFGMAIASGVYAIFLIVRLIKNHKNRLDPCKDCPYYDDCGEV